MKIGTVGSGMIVERFLRAVEENDGAECIAVYSRTLENAQRLASDYGISNMYTSYDEMLNNDEIDFIYVASPNSLHFTHSKDALLNGKNVICEKPFTSNLEELRRLTALAEEKRLFLFEAITNIHLPHMAYLKEQLSKIGKIHMIRTNYTQYSSRYQQLKQNEITNIFDLNYSGGALMDLNVYNIHFVLYLFGKPKKVTYFANRYVNGADTSGIAVLEYDGFVAECSGAKDSKGESSGFIYGEDGYIHVTSQTSTMDSILVNRDGETSEYNVQTNDNALFYEMKDIISCVQEERYEECYRLLKHSESVMCVLDEARESAGIRFLADSGKEVRYD